MPHARTRLGAAAAALAVGFSSIAGPLTPPAGPPMSTGKTLTQVEPRIDIATVPGDAGTNHIITQPGSYYLSGDVVTGPHTVCIEVRAPNVTIDLNGFTLTDDQSQGFGGGDGVRIRADLASNVVVRNGQIDVANTGVDFINGASTVLVEDVRVRSGPNGVVLGPNSVARRVSVVGASIHVEGDHCVIDSCEVVSEGPGIIDFGPSFGGTVVRNTVVAGQGINPVRGVSLGLDTTIENTLVRNSTSGISVGNRSVVRDTLVTNVFGGTSPNGITAGIRSTIENVTIVDVGGNGVEIAEGARVAGVSVSGFNATGIVAGTSALIEGSSVNSGTVSGIVASTGSIVRGCLIEDIGSTAVAIDASLVSDTAIRGADTGISMGTSSTAIGNQISAVRVDGVRGFNDNLVMHNQIDGIGSGSTGITMSVGDNRIDSNLITDHDTGIFVAPGNLVIRNALAGTATTITGSGAGNSGVAGIAISVTSLNALNPFANIAF